MSDIEISVNGEQKILVSERGAADLAPFLRDRLEEHKRRDGALISPQVWAVVEAFEAARRRRQARAQVPESEPGQVPESEPGGSSSPSNRGRMSAREAARAAGRKPRTITKAAQEGRLPGEKIGGRWLFEESDVEEYANGSQNR